MVLGSKFARENLNLEHSALLEPGIEYITKDRHMFDICVLTLTRLNLRLDW